MIFILGTSLLAGPEALQTGPFQKHMSWNSSWAGQIGPVRTTSLRSDQPDCSRTLFTKMGITLSIQLQSMHRLLHMKVDLIRFPSMYNTWGRTLYNDIEFTVKLEVRSDRSELCGSGTVFTKIGITLCKQPQWMCSLLHMKVDFKKLPMV